MSLNVSKKKLFMETEKGCWYFYEVNYEENLNQTDMSPVPTIGIYCIICFMFLWSIEVSNILFYIIKHELSQDFNWKYVSSYTHHKHRAIPTACWPLFHSGLHIGISQHLEVGLLRSAARRCACDRSAPSGYVKQYQPLLVAVDTRRHPVNAQRSLEINPVCMSILAKHTNTDRHSTTGMWLTHAVGHTRMHMVVHMLCMNYDPFHSHPHVQTATDISFTGVSPPSLSHFSSVQKKHTKYEKRRIFCMKILHL